MVETVSGGDQLLDPKFILTKAGVVENTIVADLGCGGAGHFVFPASPMVGAQGKVLAVDIQQSVLQKIAQHAQEEHYANVVTIWTDLEVFRGAKDIVDESLDVAMLINTLFQSKNKEAMMRESVRMVKRGGHLLVVEWKLSGAPFGPSKEMRVSEEVIRTIARTLQLDEVDAFEAGPYHYGILFKKV